MALDPMGCGPPGEDIVVEPEAALAVRDGAPEGVRGADGADVLVPEPADILVRVGRLVRRQSRGHSSALIS